MDPLSLLRQFLLPSGEEAARRVRRIRLTEHGEMRSSPEARWMEFTSEQTVEADRTGSRWEARFGGGRLGWISVVDAYENGHGLLAVKLGGVIPVKRLTGPEVDKGELQRCFASLLFCPPMLLNNPALEWTGTAPLSVSVRDRQDPTGATVEFDLSETGRPLLCRAERPRIEGKQIIPTPWSGAASEFQEWDGMRICSRLEVLWHMPEGPFAYYRSVVKSFSAISS